VDSHLWIAVEKTFVKRHVRWSSYICGPLRRALTPGLRADLTKNFTPLVTPECGLANLPDAKTGSIERVYGPDDEGCPEVQVPDFSVVPGAGIEPALSLRKNGF
jgi:hypothetical protein